MSEDLVRSACWKGGGRVTGARGIQSGFKTPRILAGKTGVGRTLREDRDTICCGWLDYRKSITSLP